MNLKRKITIEQRDELLKLYFEKGREAAAELSVRYGVSPKYAASVAASMGLARPLWRKGNRYKDNQVDRRASRSLNDPRWQRAKAIGVVVAYAPQPRIQITQVTQGCTCPPTSEQTCQNPLCPRKATVAG